MSIFSQNYTQVRHSGIPSGAQVDCRNPGYRDVTPQALAARQARICLYRPNLLNTPERIAAQLKPNSFALWSNEMHGIWCVSTRHDSVAFKLGQPVQVTWIELQPAKGPGYSALEIEGWTVYAGHGSRAVREAAQMLGSFSGVSVKQQGGYDC